MISNSNIELTTEIREKVKTLVKEVVVKTHSNHNKQMVKDMSDRLNLACPYCGDSSRDESAKRGNIFWSTLQYHCFNCEYHTNIYYFLNFKRSNTFNLKLYLKNKINYFV